MLDANIPTTFLAILELTKQSMIRITQDRRFGSIMIIPKKGEVPVGQS